MDGIDTLYTWTNGILWYALIVLRAWAFLDCLTRKAAAFTAADKLNKPTWLLILVAAGLLGTFLGWIGGSPLGPISLISIVAAAVYLADVRPAVREITGG